MVDAFKDFDIGYVMFQNILERIPIPERGVSPDLAVKWSLPLNPQELRDNLKPLPMQAQSPPGTKVEICMPELPVGWELQTVVEAAGPEKRNVEPTRIVPNEMVIVLEFFQERFKDSLLLIPREGLDDIGDRLLPVGLDRPGDDMPEVSIQIRALNVEEPETLGRNIHIVPAK